MPKKVTTIPASARLRNNVAAISTNVKRKVAGYARVSTDEDEQITSYAAQIDYYTNFIKARDDWEFVKIYTDEGISATNTKHREGFKAMVQAAMAGEIDLIITKSVSRFARNTVDSLITVRKLKEKGVEIYFDKENIWTLDSKGELLITIMSSLAQEESRSISENTTWGQRKRFADGKVSVGYKNFLGYDKGPDGVMVINPKEAETVKLLYRLYMSGLSMTAVAKELTRRKLPTPAGKSQWRTGVVQSILTNEKYKGDALLQKRYTADYLTKRLKKNEGEVPQYYVTGDHEAIISPEVFDLVQAEIARRNGGKERYSGISIFSNKIKCGECGSWYGSKVWHSTDKYRKVIYRCNHKFDGDKKCGTPHLTEEEIKASFVEAFNRLFTEKDELLGDLELIREKLCDNTALEKEKQELANELNVLAGMVEDCIGENARVAQNQEEYQNRYDGLVEKYEKAKARYEEVETVIEARMGKREQLNQFIKDLQARDGVLEEFDEYLWGSMVKYMMVYGKGDIRVTFKDGTEI